MADDFIDFMMSGGDELLNSFQCPHCGKWFHIDEVEENNDSMVNCPNCKKAIKLK